ncbi:MAG: phosphatidylserine decarboxylase [Lentisphaerae bacterium]|jgi:phosphatidylserine decarboxylase|nr:phosphatidylserine decarboxylase [Lentisphaerota bacterium]MBT4816831.1 phosphatidylserine decarboxylase [Lentisphaerota bacterium]MBT5612093.1 phosphatidylserine decarboxylase [Lentisphaerota bacterium]MBT7060555.1 phosphatidylserine decarboxylase [Lentisphaerota bacterium]MBT7840680.1 phosphatidylserine decarboxylase [Lentisphaerota bacterium]
MSAVQDPEQDVYVWDRAGDELVKETVLGDSMLKLAYLSPARGICRAFLFRYALVSKLMGWYCNTAWSRRKINATIAALDIDRDEFRDPIESFRTFNQFFYRHLRDGTRPFSADSDVLCSPADCRLSVFPKIDADTCIPVKGAQFAIPELLGMTADEAAGFSNGTVLVLRLCPADYHRYHYPAAGRELRRIDIPGRLDSVNPIALTLGIPVFTQNHRNVTMLDLGPLGQAAFIEVGAFGVGGIVQTHEAEEFARMDEKGFFTFGGSTIILVLEPNRLALDDDLVQLGRDGCEIRILAGESLGRLTTP